MKKYIVSFIFLVLFLLMTGCGTPNSGNEEIVKYEFQTHEYFDFLYGNPNAFYILI